jgi:hypothetical protein
MCSGIIGENFRFLLGSRERDHKSRTGPTAHKRRAQLRIFMIIFSFFVGILLMRIFTGTNTTTGKSRKQHTYYAENDHQNFHASKVRII